MREGWTFAWTTHEDLAREQAEAWDACSVEERVAAVETIRQAAFALHGVVPWEIGSRSSTVLSRAALAS